VRDIAREFDKTDAGGGAFASPSERIGDAWLGMEAALGPSPLLPHSINGSINFLES